MGARDEPVGDSATVHGNGFLPGGTVQLILKGGGVSANGQNAGDLVVATFTANADGVVDGSFTVPVTVALGTYLLQLTGPNYGGSGTQVISFSVKVSTTRTPATVALPQTGSDSSRFSTIATVAGVLGVAMVLGTRRRRSHLRVSA